MIRRLLLFAAIVTVSLSATMWGQDTIKPRWRLLPLPSREQVKGIEGCDDGLMLATGVDVYRVRDSIVLPVLDGLQHRSVTDVLYDGHLLDVATATGGMFRSTDNGLRWTEQALPGREQSIVRLTLVGSHHVVLTAKGTIYARKGWNGAWSPIVRPDTIPQIRDILTTGPRVIALADSGAVYALDRLRSWNRLVKLPVSTRILIAEASGSVYALTDTVLFRLPDNPGMRPVDVCRLPADKWQSIAIASGMAMIAGKGRRILKIDIASRTWQEMPVPGTAEDRISALFWDGATLLAGIDRGSGGLYTMRTDAPVWQSIALSNSANADVSVSRLVQRNGTVFACMTRNGLFALDTSLRRAEHRHQGIQGTALATLHRSGSAHIVTSRTAGIYRFDSCGADVERITQDLPTGEGFAGVDIHGTFYASVGRVGLWKTSNGGRRWTRCRYPDSSAYIDRMDALGSHILASARERSWISRDNGMTWSRFMVNGDSSMLRWAASGTGVQMVGTVDGAYLRHGPDTPWERITTPYTHEVRHRFGNASITGNVILMGTKGVVLLSRDGGRTWRPIDIAPAMFASYVTLVGDTMHVVSDKGVLMSAPLPKE